MIKDIVIVGGGTAGWLSAAYLTRAFGEAALGGPRITLVESEDVPSVGVGEATVPLITNTLAYLGFDEKEFMRAVSATYKIAIRFDDWLYVPQQNLARHQYYHAFGTPVGVGQEFIAPYWVAAGANKHTSFVDYSMIEGRLCEAYRAPKRDSDADFSGPFSYAYHFDAGRLASYLKTKCVAWGVNHLVDEVTQAVNDERGNISHLLTKKNGSLDTDIVLDCTGFAALLIEKNQESTWHDKSHQLFCDTAISAQIPYQEKANQLRPFTIATAQPAGWVWDIGLAGRRGVGHVYSSRHTRDSQAENLLRRYVDDWEVETKKLSMRIGYRPEPWKKNCIAICLSSGFAEPLESTGIFLIELALARLVSLLPGDGVVSQGADDFNKSMQLTMESVFDFLKLHYAVSQRDDTEFWIENCNQSTWSARLQSWLSQWQSRCPSLIDFPNVLEPFNAFSYQQVLYGMNHLPTLEKSSSRYSRNSDLALRNAEIVSDRAQNALNALPLHQHAIAKIHSMS